MSQPFDRFTFGIAFANSRINKVERGFIPGNQDHREHGTFAPEVFIFATWNMATLNGNPLIPVGNYYTDADYSGDANYIPGVGGSNTLAASKTQPVSIITNCTGPVTAGKSQSFSVSVEAQDAPTTSAIDLKSPSGQVVLHYAPTSGSSSSITNTLSDGSLGSPSTTIFSVTLTSTGTYIVHADYQGDNNYFAVTGDSCTVTVN